MRRSTVIVAVAAMGCALTAAVAVAPADAAPAGTPAATPAASPAPSPAAAPAPGAFVPLAQHRVADLRVDAWRTVTLHPRVPSSGVAAITMIVTVLAPVASGRITLWGAGAAPDGTTVQFAAGRSVADTAVVAPAAGGVVHLVGRQASGPRVRVVVDVTGYYRGGTPDGPGAFRAVRPATALDTRIGLNTLRRAVPANGTLLAAVGGHAGVPSSGVGAVAVTITTAGVRAAGTLVAYAAGTDPPPVVTAYLRPGPAASGFALVPVDAAGRFAVHNDSAAPVQVVVDVVGYVLTGAPLAAGRYKTSLPVRLVTRPLAGDAMTEVVVRGRGGVPLSAGTSIVVSVGVLSPTAAGAARVWPAGTDRPGDAVVHWTAGAPALTQTVVRLGTGGRVALHNDSPATATLTLDLQGWTAPTTIPTRTPQTGRYLSMLVDATTRPDDYLATDTAAMYDLGCADSMTGTVFVLLDLGAQTITPPLSRAHPGIALAQNVNGRNGDPARLSYPDLVTVLNAYLAAASAPTCNPHHVRPTVAIGTSNDGAWDVYTAVPRGRDFATELIGRLSPPATVTVAAANDIEPDFGTGQAQDALDWEDAYLAADGGAHTLVFNGAASGCPDDFGDTSGACTNGWELTDLYRMAHRGSGIVALPQVFTPDMARQWANIDQAGGGAIVFLGALTQGARAPGEFDAVQGYAYLDRALSSVLTAPSVHLAVGMVPDGS